MKYITHIITSLTLVTTVILAQQALAAKEPTYHLAPGDEISIKVYGEDDLSMQVRLGESGVITYPYLGNITATGKSVRQLKDFITKGLLGDILINPSVNISVVKYRNFFVAGEVKKAGGYPYQPGLTVRQAIALAGGLTEWGSKSKVELLREGADKASSAKYDTVVRPGDTVTVKEGLF